MRKFLSFLLVLVMALSLSTAVGCQKKEEAVPEVPATEAVPAPAPEAAPAPMPEAAPAPAPEAPKH